MIIAIWCSITKLYFSEAVKHILANSRTWFFINFLSFQSFYQSFLFLSLHLFTVSSHSKTGILSHIICGSHTNMMNLIYFVCNVFCQHYSNIFIACNLFNYISSQIWVRNIQLSQLVIILFSLPCNWFPLHSLVILIGENKFKRGRIRSCNFALVLSSFKKEGDRLFILMLALFIISHNEVMRF